jgi:hypothetical protein
MIIREKSNLINTSNLEIGIFSKGKALVILHNLIWRARIII